MLEAEFPVSENMPVIRSGYSATANMVINRKSTLYPLMKNISYTKNDSTIPLSAEYCDTTRNKQIINIGISDGNYVEVIKGFH